MTIFRHELRMNKKTIFTWGIVMAAIIALMAPMYIDLMARPDALSDELKEALMANPIVVGVDELENLMSPLGAYSFLTSFSLMAFAVCGLQLGINALAKERKTGDFILTKPFSRKTVLGAKLAAAAIACLVIGAFYMLASFGIMQVTSPGEFDFGKLFFISLTVPLLLLFYMVMGLLIGSIKPGIRMPTVIALAISFFTYICGTAAKIIGNDALLLLSPYKYLDAASVMSRGRYDTGLSLFFAALMIIMLICGFWVFIKRDVASSES